MSSNEENNGNFASMEPMRSNEYDYMNDISLDRTIDGIDATQHLREVMPADEPLTENEVIFGRFMRGEIEYNEYMRLTGGQTLEEEMGDEPMEEDEPYDTNDTSQEDLPLPSTSSLTSIVKTEYSPTGGVGLPVHTRNLMHEIVADELVPSKIVVSGEEEPTKTTNTISSTPVAAPTQEREKMSRKLSKTLDALLGQANLIYARGNTKEALAMLLEVIRQEPRNAVAYQQVSDIYSELGDQEKSLQYGLLSSHLDCHTPADVWAKWGDVSQDLTLLEEAAACYGRAIKMDPTNWRHYEKRIDILDRLNLRPLAMRTRLQAAQMIRHDEADFEWFHSLIKTVAQYYILINDEDRAILALEAFVLRSREFGKKAESQHETLIAMWMAKSKFMEAARSIFALCEGIKTVKKGTDEPAVNIVLSNGSYSVEPFPPTCEFEYIIDPSFSTILLTKLTVCLIGFGKMNIATPLKDILLTRDLSNGQEEGDILDIAKAYYNCDAFKTCKVFLEKLRDWRNYNENSELWFIYGNCLASLRDPDGAMTAFERSLQINPSHVDARINLSGLQQKAGMSDKALETLQDYDLDSCTHLPDERLLIRQADVLFDGLKTDQFVRCVRMLLTPHFYEIHRQPDLLHKRRQSKTAAGIHLSNTLRVAAMNAIQNSNLEKFVKRLGSVAAAEGRSTDDIDPTLLHDYCLKLIECLMSKGRYQDMLVVCCYAFLQPRINKHDKSSNFQNMLYFASIKANSWALAFEYVRWFHTVMNSSNAVMPIEHREVLYKRIFNAMNYVFCHSQNVSYHRYIMRALSKSPGNHALQTISGNNSLITGTYRHALGEYLRVWSLNKKNPLICLLLALTFTHMSCKKDLSSRHMLAVRGIGFMKSYQKVRTCRQEVFYNIGRMFHQMSITPLAIHFYEKVLTEAPPTISVLDEDCNEVHVPLDRYDLRRLAAHNLALIYKSSGNEYLARKVYEQFLVI